MKVVSLNNVRVRFPDNPEDWGQIQRWLYIFIEMITTKEVVVREIAQKTGLTAPSVYYIMNRLGLPVVQLKAGVWSVLRLEDEHYDE